MAPSLASRMWGVKMGAGGGSPGEEGPGRSFERLAFRFVQAGFLIRPSVPRPNTPEIIFI